MRYVKYLINQTKDSYINFYEVNVEFVFMFIQMERKRFSL